MKVFGTDYDGVIINVEPQKAQAFGDLLNKRWGVNKGDASKFWLETGGKSRRSKFDHFYNLRFGRKLSEDDYITIESEYSHKLRTEFYPTLTLLPGTLDLLQYARTHFDYMFVSSGVPMQEIEYLANLNGVARYFDKILGTNEKYPSKEKHFQEIMLAQKPDMLVFVADGAEDMKVAREFGAIAIGVNTNRPKEELTAAGANYTCNVVDVVPVISDLIGKRQK